MYVRNIEINIASYEFYYTQFLRINSHVIRTSDSIGT